MSLFARFGLLTHGADEHPSLDEETLSVGDTNDYDDVKSWATGDDADGNPLAFTGAKFRAMNTADEAADDGDDEEEGHSEASATMLESLPVDLHGLWLHFLSDKPFEIVKALNCSEWFVEGAAACEALWRGPDAPFASYPWGISARWNPNVDVTRQLLQMRIAFVPCTQLCFADGTTDEDLLSAAPFLAGAENLQLSKCEVSDEGVIGLLRAAPSLAASLRVLGLHRTRGVISDATVDAVAALCPDISELGLSAAGRHVTSASIVRLVAARGENIAALGLAGTNIDDEAVVAVARCCPKLRILDVSGTGGRVTDVGIRAIARSRCAPALTDLFVSWTGGAVTDASLLELIDRAEELRRVGVHECRGAVTDKTVVALVGGRCGALLRRLDIGGACGAITDKSVEIVAARSKKLENLDLQNAGGTITDASVRLLPQSCPKLATVDLSYCGATFSKTTLLAFAESCPELSLFEVHGMPGGVDASVAERFPIGAFHW